MGQGLDGFSDDTFGWDNELSHVCAEILVGDSLHLLTLSRGKNMQSILASLVEKGGRRKGGIWPRDSLSTSCRNGEEGGQNVSLFSSERVGFVHYKSFIAILSASSYYSPFLDMFLGTSFLRLSIFLYMINIIVL